MIASPSVELALYFFVVNIGLVGWFHDRSA